MVFCRRWRVRSSGGGCVVAVAGAAQWWDYLEVRRGMVRQLRVLLQHCDGVDDLRVPHACECPLPREHLHQ